MQNFNSNSISNSFSKIQSFLCDLGQKAMLHNLVNPFFMRAVIHSNGYELPKEIYTTMGSGFIAGVSSVFIFERNFSYTHQLASGISGISSSLIVDYICPDLYFPHVSELPYEYKHREYFHGPVQGYLLANNHVEKVGAKTLIHAVLEPLVEHTLTRAAPYCAAMFFSSRNKAGQALEFVSDCLSHLSA